ncbi:low molecular weight protein tyrosine phosphatase family protein [Uliginosibacterium gangwonense]|uniref:low molecular weight protein tyrosine phosphatase family protein n=1 Tax=Uliginosibacterium gangwonense TaxID=392736 RepID=UPI00036880ED|nr:low molecular weight protein tyrosine phosphatase family protein [Uliginosibacterium gangwonense]
MKKVLFVCGKNRWRSPTAEQIFADHPCIVCNSAGLSHDADNPLTSERVAWADLIFVMEKAQRSRLNKQFKHALHGQRVICLDIPYDYTYMDPALIGLLKARITPKL